MIDIYHCYPTRSLRVIWALEELDLQYRINKVASPFRDNLPKDVKHAGLLPLVVHEDVAYTESIAICELLARRYGSGVLIVEPEAANYQPYVENLWFGEATMGSLTRPLRFYGPSMPAEEQIPEVYHWARAGMEHRLRVLEGRLADSPFLAGSELTLADLSVCFPLFVLESIGEHSLFGAHTAAYWSRVKARPAFARALARAQD